MWSVRRCCRGLAGRRRRRHWRCGPGSCWPARKARTTRTWRRRWGAGRRRCTSGGLYLDPPDKAMVLAVDEKSQMQALDRSAPVLPMMPGVPGRQTHDYIRYGTTSLFAALDVATGKVIGQHQRRHRHQEFLRFLKTIDKNTPAELDLHLICDNYGTHKKIGRASCRERV